MKLIRRIILCVIIYKMTDGDVGLVPKADICDGNG